MAQVVVSASAVEKLQRRVIGLERHIAKDQEERSELLKRIDAMKILLAGTRNGHRPKPKVEELATPPAPVAHQLKIGETMGAKDTDGPSVPEAVKDVLNKKGRMSAVELRHAIIAAGVPREKLGATFSYLYTVLGRLAGRGQLRFQPTTAQKRGVARAGGGSAYFACLAMICSLILS